MDTTYPERIIAVDVRPQSIGFVVFKGDRVLDWGVKRFRGGVSAVRVPPGPKIRRLILEYAPDALVFKRPRTGSERMLGEVKRVAEAQHVTTRTLSEHAVKRVFGARHNKEEIAIAVSDRFPELVPFLPPKRKIWNSEDYWMRVFDAAALAIAYFSQSDSVSRSRS